MYIENIFNQVIGLAYSRVKDGLVKLDLTNENDVNEFMRKEKPNFLIHCAAERHPDIVNYKEDICRDINGIIIIIIKIVKSVETLAKISKEIGCWMIYISTDYVFDGRNPPYKTDDKRNPLNKYGKSKADGEDVMNKYLPKGLILRVGVLYGKTNDLSESASTFYTKYVFDNISF